MRFNRLLPANVFPAEQLYSNAILGAAPSTAAPRSSFSDWGLAFFQAMPTNTFNLDNPYNLFQLTNPIKGDCNVCH